jgi:hypothetical protein
MGNILRASSPKNHTNESTMVGSPGEPPEWGRTGCGWQDFGPKGNEITRATPERLQMQQILNLTQEPGGAKPAFRKTLPDPKRI